MTQLSTQRLPREVDPNIRLALEFEDGRRHSLPHGRPLVLGSDPDSDLRLHDPFVSAAHARVHFAKDEGYVIEDLDSTNGIAVDGVSVHRATLEPGMAVALGRQRMLVTRVDQHADEARPRRTRAQVDLRQSAHRLVGRSDAMIELRRTLERLAALPLPVLIHGETGTGKELAARTLHEFGPRAEAPFVALNCAAVPAGLFESELFGHRRGAFTGAHRDHAGVFLRAEQGTVFLDEVAELPAAAQAKLLRVLETRLVCPVGGDRELEIRCRIVAATHRDLGAMVRDGQFREDLYHRLGVVEVTLPPLRRRRADIPVLLDHFVGLAAAELEREVSLSKAAAAAAISHAWPGNVRALRNAVLRAAALADGPISAELLLPRARQPVVRRSDSIAVPRGDYASMHASLLQQVLREEGSIRKAARTLGVPRSTLGAWLNKLASA
ncbi:sigma 54-interacting transcriptional regulator [Pseudenhygromyxa sp. WMMC2535]|uniref:sigma 54-interacting transcriptional regulator n=1 Tax=Pseudenhygromyxa sp. WMMC2535 TaxID=2712867 RepID=UPI0015544980|nr:sigma 54-interacting transcriptional regulator [Pseudenhygromyxa sp. WMMC2535]NVB42754.1 sigma 54-interacting transcriptional regulator [Pseudenhygromyxa sp. WMMC2535]